MSEHLDAEQLLSLAIDATGGSGDHARAHVATCASCAARLRENQAMFALIDGANALPPVPPALRARVLASASASRARKAATAWSKLAILAAVVTSALLAWHDGLGGRLRLIDLVPHLGVHCLAFQGGFAAIPLVVGMALSRAGKVKLEPLAFSAWSMGFAVLGQLALHGRCEASNLSVHLFAVHFVGVLLAGLLSGGIVRMLQPARTA